MHSDSRFSFRNLQPISYLNQFNNMVEYTQRHPGESSARSQLNLVSLNKFPISRYYEDMEGIFESLVRKKQDQGIPQRTRENVEEQKFMERHNQFMRKVLTKFIIHNEQRMALLDREKKKPLRAEKQKTHLRSSSEPKLIKKAQPTPLELPEIANPKPQTPTPKPSAIKDFRTHPEIVSLQLKQAKRQSVFSQKIEQQIAKFDKEMESQVQTIKQFRFWKELEPADTGKKERKMVPTQTMELDFGLKNFTST